MLVLFLLLYLTSLAAGYASTLVLILSGASWRSMPHKYLQAVLFLQGFFARDTVALENIIAKEPACQFDLLSNNKSGGSSSATTMSTTSDYSSLSDQLDEESGSVLEGNMLLIRAGVEAIVQHRQGTTFKDEVLSLLGNAPLYKVEEPTNLAKRILHSIRQLVCSQQSRNLGTTLLLILSAAVRIAILFPIRLALVLTSFVFAAGCCLSACLLPFDDRRKTQVAVIYCRMFSAGTGLVANYHNVENRPTNPGVAVANHLSPNDIQIIGADMRIDKEYFYIVTGQKHQGIIWAIQRLVEKVCSCIWLERACPEERKNFTKAVIDGAKSSGPVLIFPEGYCTNNTKVLQFRRAVFEDEINVHPVAIKQDARFGDGFWAEDQFLCYLLRVLTSWAIVYDVYYLPAQRRLPDETSTEFARRVQCLIAEAAGCPAAGFDGGIYYKPHERLKLLRLAQQQCANQLAVRKVGPEAEEEGTGKVEQFIRCNGTIPEGIPSSPTTPMQIDFPSSTASSSSCMSNGFITLQQQPEADDGVNSEEGHSSIGVLDESGEELAEEDSDDGALLNG